MAIAALVAGIANFVVGWGMFGILGIAAVVLGLIALNQIQQTHQQGRGMAIAGIVLGAISLALALMVFSFMGWMFGGGLGY